MKNRPAIYDRGAVNFIFLFPSSVSLRSTLSRSRRIQTHQSLRDSSPFMGAFPNRKPSLKGKVANRRFDGRVLKPSPQGEGAEQSEADEG